MAAVASWNTRWQQYRTEGAALRTEIDQHLTNGRELIRRNRDHMRRGDLLFSERYPGTVCLNFIDQIPATLIRLITECARCILLLLISLVSCGLNRYTNNELKNCFRTIRRLPYELFYLFKAVICPSTGIDAYYDSRSRSVNP